MTGSTVCKIGLCGHVVHILLSPSVSIYMYAFQDPNFNRTLYAIPKASFFICIDEHSLKITFQKRLLNFLQKAILLILLDILHEDIILI